MLPQFRNKLSLSTAQACPQEPIWGKDNSKESLKLVRSIAGSCPWVLPLENTTLLSSCLFKKSRSKMLSIVPINFTGTEQPLSVWEKENCLSFDYVSLQMVSLEWAILHKRLAINSIPSRVEMALAEAVLIISIRYFVHRNMLFRLGSV